jgi:multiple sugar transport system permease protein
MGVLPGKMKSRSNKSLSVLATYTMLCIVAFLALAPFLWMVSTSLKATDKLTEVPPRWIPDPIVPHNYIDAVHDPKTNFPLWTRNTLIVAGLCVIGMTLSSAVAAYGFARIKFRGRGTLFVIMLSTMMVPFPVIMVPTFLIFHWLDVHTPFQFLGTFKPLWLPAWFGSAFSIFLLRQFFITIPEELSEAARIDGCGEFGIFWRIILPLSHPALSVVALFTFMAAWRDFLGPLVYLQRPSQYTLALGLQTFQSQNGGSPWNLLMAASVLVIAPVILLFFLAQKTFIEGIATTGMKG